MTYSYSDRIIMNTKKGTSGLLKIEAKFLTGAIILPLCFLFGFSFFGSCASGAKNRKDLLYVYLTDTSKFFLLPAGAIEKPMDMAQYISASFQNQDYLMLSWVKADETAVEMTLLNEMGATMGELSYRDGIIFFSSPLFPDSFKPEYIIADFQLCFYNTALLGRALKNCGLVLESGGTVRRILKGKNLICEIEKSAKMVKITNHLRGYTYTLEGDFS